MTGHNGCQGHVLRAAALHGDLTGMVVQQVTTQQRPCCPLLSSGSTPQGSTQRLFSLTQMPRIVITVSLPGNMADVVSQHLIKGAKTAAWVTPASVPCRRENMADVVSQHLTKEPRLPG